MSDTHADVRRDFIAFAETLTTEQLRASAKANIGVDRVARAAALAVLAMREEV